jgi:hypothetical protein
MLAHPINVGRKLIPFRIRPPSEPLRKKGANIFNPCVSLRDIRAAKAYSIQFIRLALEKFPSKRRNFLMGDVNDYCSFDPNDLTFLKLIPDMFIRENMPVVITMLGLTGSRWKQVNGDKDHLRI